MRRKEKKKAHGRETYVTAIRAILEKERADQASPLANQ